MRLWGWLQKRCALRAWYYVLPGVKCIVSGESVLCVCIGECGAIADSRDWRSSEDRHVEENVDLVRPATVADVDHTVRT